VVGAKAGSKTGVSSEYNGYLLFKKLKRRSFIAISCNQSVKTKITKGADAMNINNNLPHEPHRYKKRLGSTTFHVVVHSNLDAKETAGDKITRLIRNEAALLDCSITASGKAVKL
jgi:hypothetical protein